MKFKVGDKVIIKDYGEIFSTYEDWLNIYVKKEEKKYWNKGEFINNGEIYTIKAKGKHSISRNLMLYYIQNNKSKQCYIISEKGIEKTREKFFKSLPNDFTGTLEVENGYIVEKEILDDVEKEYLSAVIRPFKNRISDIVKRNFDSEKSYIVIHINSESFYFPYFKKGTMYEGMEADKQYTLKELGL